MYTKSTKKESDSPAADSTTIRINKSTKEKEFKLKNLALEKEIEKKSRCFIIQKLKTFINP